MNQFTKQLAILFIALTSLQSCDVEKFIDANIKEKSLVVIAPDFIQNRVAIVFEDADTGAVIEEDLEVRLIASEMLIDLSGNYKNDFTAKKGLLNFAVDPNKEVNENNPLFFEVLINDHLSNQSFFKVSNNNTLIRIPVKNMPSVNLDSEANKTSGKSDTEMPITLNFNGKTIDEFKAEIENQIPYSGYKIFNSTGTQVDYFNYNYFAFFIYNVINNIDDETILKYFFDIDHNNIMNNENSSRRHFRQLIYSGYDEDQRYSNQNYLFSQPELKKPTIISVKLNPGFSWANIYNYKLNIKLANANNEILYYRIKGLGDYDLRSRPTQFSLSSSLRLPNEYKFEKSAKFQPWNNEIAIPAGSRIIHVDLTTITNSETQQCEEGFNLNFEMIGVNEDDKPNLLYKTERNSGATSHIGYASLTKGNSSHNTASFSNGHSYGKLSNKIIFEDNLQYDIIPNTMELGGVEACGKTYNFKVVAKDYLEKYKMNIQFQCSGDEFSTAPTLVAFLNEANTPDKVDMINLNNGSTSLYLKPEGKYEVLGVFNETEFGFTFTANEDNVEAAIASTIANNDNILDIEYTISKINNVESVINAKIIFKEGACPE